MSRLSPSRLSTHLTRTLLAFVLIPSTPASPQTSTPLNQQTAPQNPAQHLQQLTTTQQAALDSKDPAQIVATSRQLASFALSLLGNLYASESRPDLAADTLIRSFDLAPDLDTGLALITSDLDRKRPQDADRIAQQLLDRAGENPSLHLMIASARHAGDDLPGTIAELTRAVALNPRFAPVHTALGNAFWELNEYQYNADSLREFTAAQRLDPAGYLANFDLGAILSQYQRYPEAAPFLEHAAAADPDSPDPWLQLGMNAYAQNLPSPALSALTKSVTLTGADQARNSYQIRRVYAVLSRLHAEAGRTLEAQEASTRADQVHALMLAGDIASPLSQSTGLVVNNAPTKSSPTTPRSPTFAAGANPAASTSTAPPTAPQQQLEQQLQTIIATSLNDAGTALARSRDYAAALPLFRQAAAADPTLSAATRNLGLAAFHTGSYDEAIAALTRTLEHNPGDTLARQDLDQSIALRQASPSPSAPPEKPQP